MPSKEWKKTESILIRMTEEERDQLAILASETKKSKPQYVRDMIKKEFAKRK